ncbi:hypothetical protein [Nocardia caishijiensis]|uniref:hypothetical protein n=1 Tax=Nocardia caishijiensis TaxID=184756 RepID=UPI0012ED069E|nr:hypothetical protein [Nocardia caishijiensis]
MTVFGTLDAVFRERSATDVLVPGWIDRGIGYSEFRPQPTIVYMRLDEGYLQFESIDQYDQLKIEYSSELNLAGVLHEEGDEILVASCGENLFGDGYTALRCASIRYFLDDNSRVDQGIVKCMEMKFQGASSLFIDPMWTFGIRLGGADLLVQWRQNIERYSNVQEYLWDLRSGDNRLVSS